MYGNKPIIGIVGSTKWSTNPAYMQYEFSITSTANVESVRRNGGVPIIIPYNELLDDPAAAVSMCDGLLFPGGSDVHPWYYGEEPRQVLGTIEPHIDEAWLNAGKEAMKLGLPMFGLCRGIQVLNVLTGGSLWQDVRESGEGVLQHLQKLDRTYLTHTVVVEEGTHLAEILGAGPHKTNSLHHQAVKRLGEGMRITARTLDGIIEGIEDEDGWRFGVQWHPENLIDSNPEMNKLFAKLVENARKYAMEHQR